MGMVSGAWNVIVQTFTTAPLFIVICYIAYLEVRR